MTSKNNQVLQTAHREQKNFSYTKGNVSLNFSLFTDVKTDLKDFVEILQKAVQDVQKVLDTNFPPKK